MKKLLLGLCAVFICTIAIAHTINWHAGNQILSTTTCNTGDDITPPTAPAKYGYHLKAWIPYIPLEYIEATGTQYIDTGVIYTSKNHKVVIRLSDVNSSGNSWLFGGYNGNARSGSLAAQSGNLLSVGVGDISTSSQQYTINKPSSPTTVTFNVKEDDTFSLTGGSTNYTNMVFGGDSITNTTELLFATHDNGGSAFLNSSYKLYMAQFYDNSTLVRDFIPVLDKNGVPCMYDKVTDRFFYNQGTGQFIAGPEIQ